MTYLSSDMHIYQGNPVHGRMILLGYGLCRLYYVTEQVTCSDKPTLKKQNDEEKKSEEEETKKAEKKKENEEKKEKATGSLMSLPICYAIYVIQLDSSLPTDTYHSDSILGHSRVTKGRCCFWPMIHLVLHRCASASLPRVLSSLSFLS